MLAVSPARKSSRLAQKLWQYMPPVDVNALAAAVPLDFHDPISPVVEGDRRSR